MRTFKTELRLTLKVLPTLLVGVWTISATAQTPPPEGNRVPVQCAATNSTATGGTPGRVRQYPCQDFDLNAFVALKRTQLAAKGFSSNAVGQNQRRKWFANQGLNGICVYQNTAWNYARVALRDEAQRPTINNSSVAIISLFTCDAGITMSLEDVANGPTIANLGKDESRLPRFRVRAGLRKPYFDSGLTSPPTIADTDVIGDCKRQNRAGAVVLNERCQMANPNSDSFCYARNFREPTEKFPFRGYWWVMGPYRQNGGILSELKVCSGGVSTYNGQELANTNGKNVIKYNVRTMSGAEFTANVAPRLFDARGEAYENISDRFVDSDGYGLTGVTKCLAGNPEYGGRDKWYECRWGTKIDQNRFSSSTDDSELDYDTDPASGRVTVSDFRSYDHPKHEDFAATCLIRRPVRGLNIDFIRYRVGGMTHRARIDTTTGDITPHSRVDDGTNHNYGGTPASYRGRFFGPLSVETDDAAVIVMRGPVLRSPKVDSRPVAVRACSSVEYIGKRVFRPAN